MSSDDADKKAGSAGGDGSVPLQAWMHPVKWVITTAAILVIGPVAGMMTGGLHRADASTHATPLISEDPMSGVLAIVVAIVLAFALAVPAARFFGQRFALAAAGFVVAWAAWRTGDVDRILRGVGDTSPFGAMSVEGLIVAALSLPALYLLFTIGRARLEPERREFRTERSLLADLSRLVKLPTLACIGAGVVVSGVVVFVVANDANKGQAILASFAAGIAGAALGRVAGASISDDVHPLGYVIPACVLAVVAPLVSVPLAGGAEQAMTSADAGTLPGIALLTPLDWLAGALLGVPVGLSWVQTVVEQSDDAVGTTSRPGGVGKGAAAS